MHDAADERPSEEPATGADEEEIVRAVLAYVLLERGDGDNGKDDGAPAGVGLRRSDDTRVPADLLDRLRDGQPALGAPLGLVLWIVVGVAALAVSMVFVSWCSSGCWRSFAERSVTAGPAMRSHDRLMDASLGSSSDDRV
jgi:hypothetical protein